MDLGVVNTNTMPHTPHMDGTTVAQRREALGLSRPKLAAEIGVDHSTLYRWESGEFSPSKLAERAIEAALSRLERERVVSSERAG